MNFVVLWLYAKVFFGVWRPLVRQKRAIHESFLHESFLRENRIFNKFVKVFSLESFPLYSTS